MQLRNTLSRWGIVSQTFHWVIVALVITQFFLARAEHHLPLGLAKFAILARHKAIGITILGLAVLRLLWRWMNPAPPLPDTLRPYERILARVTHFGLYFFLFAMPITGWILSSASNFPVSYFGWFTLPNLVTPDKHLADVMHEVHETLFKILAAFAVLHTAAALKHHFVLKDDVLRRMLPQSPKTPR
ncbi:MAG TPA: cytochrome b [Steroidobacteraceae bacterium]|nr:cytochrome b [Steroidobacteraceae bacterium]